MTKASTSPILSLCRGAAIILGVMVGLAACATRPPHQGTVAKGKTDLSLSLPDDSRGRQNGSSQPRKQIVIQVGREGALTVDGSRCRPEQLVAKLERLAQRGPFRVLVRVSGESAMARCLLVVDACRSAGIEHISLMAR